MSIKITKFSLELLGTGPRYFGLVFHNEQSAEQAELILTCRVPLTGCPGLA